MIKNYSVNQIHLNLLFKLFSSFLFLFIILLPPYDSIGQTLTPDLITNIKPSTTHIYSTGQLIVGATIHTDRVYQTTSVPAFLNNAIFIKTPNDDKTLNSTSAFTFD